MRIKFVYEVDLPGGSTVEWDIKDDEALATDINRLMNTTTSGKTVRLELLSGQTVIQSVDHLHFVVFGEAEKIEA